MSGLGLAAYSSSDEDEGTAQEVAQAAAAPAPAQPLQAPAASTAQRTTGAGGGGFSVFDRGSRKRCRHHKTGLPMFSRPLSAQGDSDSEEEERRGSKHRGAAKKNGGSLAFLPEPQNPIPVRDDPAPGPSNEPTTSTIEFFPTTETAEMYRMTDAETGPQSAAAGPSTAQVVTPEALLAQSMQAGQHIEFKEINANEIQQAAPHERSEIEALRTAMGSEHVKHLTEAAASASGPSKRQKQRHQITSLYHHAKATELQDMQRKTSTNRSKAATQAKYGW